MSFRIGMSVLILGFLTILAPTSSYAGQTMSMGSDPPTPELRLPSRDLPATRGADNTADSALLLFTSIGSLDPEPLPRGVSIQSFVYSDRGLSLSYEVAEAFTSSRYTLSLVLASAASTNFGAELLINEQVVAGMQVTVDSDRYTRYETSVEGATLSVAISDTITLNVFNLAGSAGGMLSAAPPNGTFVLIEDEPAVPQISISASSSAVDEDAGLAIFDVTLDQTSTQTITVDIQLPEGTATPGDDFALTPNTLTFLPGEQAHTISATITDDEIDEPDESFTVSLSNPVNAELSDTSTAAVLIRDNDAPPQLAFPQTTLALREDQGNVALTIVADAASAYTMTVDCAVTGGTARQGEDFILAAQTVSFAPGETSQLVTLMLVNDDIAEDVETAIVTLSNPRNSELSSAPSLLIEIADDEGGDDKHIYLPLVFQ